MLLKEVVERPEHARIISRCGEGELCRRIDGRRKPCTEGILHARAQHCLLRHDAAAEHDALRIHNADNVRDGIRKGFDEQCHLLLRRRIPFGKKVKHVMSVKAAVRKPFCAADG